MRAIPIAAGRTEQIFPSIGAAAKALGVHKSTVSMAVGPRIPSAAGYRWERVT